MPHDLCPDSLWLHSKEQGGVGSKRYFSWFSPGQLLNYRCVFDRDSKFNRERGGGRGDRAGGESSRFLKKLNSGISLF